MSNASEAVQEITKRVDKAMENAAADPTLGVRARDIPPVTAAVVAKVAPVVLHATNNEPWYQSRVTWGAIASIALPLLGAVGVSSDVIDADQFVALGLALGTAAGGVLTLYGRWKAKKPLGS